MSSLVFMKPGNEFVFDRAPISKNGIIPKSDAEPFYLANRFEDKSKSGHK
ncbi:hypothetical protein [Aerosakkonema sp. BLCC-F183]